MIIKKRKLNRNEIFCCSVLDLKSIFQPTDVFCADFAYFNRDYQFDEHRYNGKDYSKKRFNGKIVMRMFVSETEEIQHEKYISKFTPSADFYVLKESEYSEDLHNEFVQDVLPRMYKAFNEHKHDDPKYRGGQYCMYLELTNGKLIVHEENR